MMKKGNISKNIIVRWLALTLLLTLTNVTYSQNSDTLKAFPIVHADFGAYLPGGGLANRFGWNVEIGTGFWWKTKTNWLLGVDGSFILGDHVRDDSTILDNLINLDGGIVGEDGQYVLYQLYERGYKLPVFKVGKIFPVRISNANVNSGFFATIGAGFMQHKIRIYDQSKNFVHIRDDYVKGYDKLTNGLMLNESFGYMYFGKRRRVNFYVSIDLVQGFTKNRRSFNFDTRTAENEPRLDLQHGMKVGWIIPIYKKMAEGYYIR